MRDLRDAKAMAQSLREEMSTKHIALTHGETLEIVSKMLGLADWNTLSALIVSDREPVQPRPNGQVGATLPVLPIKDLIPFPATQLPLWIKRPKTIQALSKAFSSGREIVLVAQKSQTVDEPSRDDVYDVGVIARVLDVGPPSDDMIVRSPVLEGSTQVLLQTQGRVNIRNFSGQAGSYEADVELIDEGPIQNSPELIERAATLFDSYVAAHDIVVPQMWPPIRRLNDPGRVADLMVQRLPFALELRQTVLATIDPIAKLELVVAQMEA